MARRDRSHPTRRTGFVAASSVTALLVVSLGLALPLPARAAVPGSDGAVAFIEESSNGRNGDIVTINPGGFGQSEAYVTLDETAQDPAFSPDGTQIASSKGTSVHEIWVVNVDGPAPHQITHDAAGDSEPTWSPDGSKIAYQKGSGSGANVWVVNADGSTLLG